MKSLSCHIADHHFNSRSFCSRVITDRWRFYFWAPRGVCVQALAWGGESSEITDDFPVFSLHTHSFCLLLLEHQWFLSAGIRWHICNIYQHVTAAQWHVNDSNLQECHGRSHTQLLSPAHTHSRAHWHTQPRVQRAVSRNFMILLPIPLNGSIL